MATEFEDYLAVLKASYDYDPQSEDEIAIRENQLLFLLQQVDDDWWKVKVKGDSQEDETPVGLVPAAYVEPAIHKSVVKALYDYAATAPGELTVLEDEILFVFDEEEDWLLVQSQTEGGKAGFVPGNYVELTNLDGESEADSRTPSSAIIVPPSPPPVVSNYQDPADRVASASSKARADDIKTWSVTEVDKKGKKKKGTLGVGNGAVFFASESDKTPVRKWRTSDMSKASIEKSKHVHVSFGDADPISLHFNAGSKDTAEAILDKLRSSSALHSSVSSDLPDKARSPTQSDAVDHEKTRRSGVSVHFSEASPDIIPSRDSGEYEEYEMPYVKSDEEVGEGENAIALYDFHADGDDELSVAEGERLMVIERDGDEWWKCRNSEGAEGVVPASYIELATVLSTSPVQDLEDSPNADARHAEELQRNAEREAAELAREERVAKDRAAAKERVEKERAEKKRAEQVRTEKERAEKDRAGVEKERKADIQRRAEAVAAAQRRSEVTQSPSHATASNGGTSSATRPSVEGNRPPTGKTRVWHDRSGQFRVEAAFLGLSNGKIRLHKVNGVVVEVPTEKMSVEDMRYVEKIIGRKKGSSTALRADDDDEPLAERRKSLQTTDSQRRSSPVVTPAKKGPQIDWFEFFLSAGCDLDDCTRYATSFERDKIDQSILPDITDATMRSLGLREGDIIRVTKAIQKSQNRPNQAAQMLLDEQLARQLQAEEIASGGGTRKSVGANSAPNLFAGPGGALKNNSVRRGRPQPSKSLPPSTVDLDAITSASDHIQRAISPQVTNQVASSTTPSASTSSPTQSNPGERSNALKPTNGFDDDAWINRPSSAKPVALTAPASTRAPSAPPASTSTSKSQTATPAPQPQQAASGLAATTEADILDQLSRLSLLKANKPSPSPSPASAPPSMNAPLPNFNSPPVVAQMQPISTVPQLGQHSVGPRGPFAPIPANQGLLQPLVPTTTSFNAFVPTRVPSVPSPFQNQPPAFLVPAVPGYPAQPILSQPTGLPMNGYVSSPFVSNGIGAIRPQPTGFSPSFALDGGIPPVPPLPSLAPSVTDSTSPANVFAQMTSGPPTISIPSSSPNNTSPANVFAQMKSGTFATGNEASNPQLANKYDALRTTPLSIQPTGYMGYTGTTYPPGFSGF